MCVGGREVSEPIPLNLGLGGLGEAENQESLQKTRRFREEMAEPGSGGGEQGFQGPLGTAVTPGGGSALASSRLHPCCGPPPGV